MTTVEDRLELNKILQEEEIEVLSSIYAEELHSVGRHEWRLDITLENSSEPLKLFFKFPATYPQECPSVSLSCSSLSTEDCRHLEAITRDKLLEWKQEEEGVMFRIVEWLRMDALEELSISTARETCDASSQEEQEEEEFMDYNIQIHHGTPVTDRKSKFQAHCAVIQSRKEAEYVIRKLKENKKIANATHNIVAYRILNTGGSSAGPSVGGGKGGGCLEAFRDDDGESAAGDKLLYLLERLQATNLIVIVTRWYGGIMLGPARFKHIVRVAKDIIQENNLAPPKP